MTWENAVKEAARRIAALPIPPPPDKTPAGEYITRDLSGLRINLLDFDSDTVCQTLTGMVPVVFHKTVIRAMKRDLEKRGAVVYYKMVTVADTLQWRKAGPPA